MNQTLQKCYLGGLQQIFHDFCPILEISMAAWFNYVFLLAKISFLFSKTMHGMESYMVGILFTKPFIEFAFHLSIIVVKVHIIVCYIVGYHVRS
jgi:hypothetical protein